MSALALGALWAWTQGHRTGVERALVTAAALGALWAGWRAASWALTFGHRRDVVEPMARALSDLVGRHSLESARHFLDVPPDFAEPGGRLVTVRLHPGWHALDGERLAVEAVVSAKLGVSDLSYSWSTSGRRPHVTVRPKHHPPELVRFTDPAHRHLVEGLAEPSPLLGLTTGGRSVPFLLDVESPHCLVASAPGGGKSELLKTLVAQLVHHGATASMFDIKRISHPWAVGVPGVEIVRDVSDMHHALVALGAETERRVEAVEGADVEASELFPRHVVAIDESNVTIARLRRWWDRNRDRGDPKSSPAVDALADVLLMGRQVRCHVLLVAQSATARALGGPEVRECFSARVLARYSRNAWAMLCGDVSPVPPSTRHRGRWQVVLGGEARPTQALYFTDDEARAWASAGVDVRVPGDHPLDDLAKRAVTVPGRPELRLVTDDGPGGLVTLRQALDAGTVGPSLDAVRRARGRDPAFPAHVAVSGDAHLYRLDQLAHWQRNRQRAGVAEGEW